MLPCLQSSHKLQVVVVCEEALPRITYSARMVDVGPVVEHLATEMVREAQPSISEVRASLPDPGCHAALGDRSQICPAAQLARAHREWLSTALTADKALLLADALS